MEEKLYWEEARFQLYQEAQGLESRIGNSRRQLFEHEQELKRLQATFALPARSTIYRAATLEPFSEINARPMLSFGFRWQQWQQQHQATEKKLQSRLLVLRHLAGDLADQRLYLAEQYERLAQAQQQWQENSQAVGTELEAVEQRLGAREMALEKHAQAVAKAGDELHQRAGEIARTQRDLASRSARLAASEASWEGERERLLASLGARENLVERQLAALDDLRERWGKRRKRQVCWLRAQRDMCERLRREGEALRQEWLRRSSILSKDQRALAERALALEQYRQHCIARATNPKAAEKRLRRLRRRWAALGVSAERKLTRERKSLEAQAARLEEQARTLRHDNDQLADQEAELSTRQPALEQQQLEDRRDQEKMQQELHSLRRQRHSYEQQLEALRQEVERLARALLDESDATPLPAAQAA
jgi:chromosome segregation ATPase